MDLLNNGLRAYEDRRWSGWGGSSRSLKVPTLGLGGAPIKTAGPNDPGVAIGLASSGSAANENAKNVPPVSGTLGGDFGGPAISAANAAANARFFAAAQNDFAARLKWSVTPKFADANHEPKVRIKGPQEVSAQPGNTVRLEGEVSDPDQDAVKVLWWQDGGAGTYPGDVHFSDSTALSTKLLVPNNAKPGETIHIILEGTDNGTPPLTRYQRLVVRIK